MTEIIFLVQDSPEGGYEARALDHSIYTEGDTLDELRFMIKDAVSCHFDILTDVAQHFELFTWWMPAGGDPNPARIDQRRPV